MSWTTAQLQAAITALNAPGDTDAQIAALLNAQTSTGSVPTETFFTGNEMFNCIVWSEFEAITAAQQTLLLQVCAIPGNLLGGSASPFIAPFFGTLAAKMPNTITALVALAQALVTPVWSPPVLANDVFNARGGI